MKLPCSDNMTMTLDTSQQQRFAPPLNFDYGAHAQPPAFSNPWSSASSPPQSAATSGNPLFVHGQQPPALSHHSMMAAKPPPGRASTSSASSMASYGSMPVPTSSSGKYRSSHSPDTILTRADLDIMSLSRMQTTSAAYGDPSYTTSASPVSGHFAPTSAPPYEAMGYAPAPARQHFSLGPEPDTARRYSHHQLVTPHQLVTFTSSAPFLRGNLRLSH